MPQSPLAQSLFPAQSSGWSFTRLRWRQGWHWLPWKGVLSHVHTGYFYFDVMRARQRGAVAFAPVLRGTTLM